MRNAFDKFINRLVTVRKESGSLELIKFPHLKRKKKKRSKQKRILKYNGTTLRDIGDIGTSKKMIEKT